MKYLTLQLLLSCFLVSLTAMSVYAAVPNGSTYAAVAYTVHNLSYNNDISKGLTNDGGDRRYTASAEGANQVCVFCHTPHNASPAVPLWNKITPANRLAYRLYTTSPTLSDTAKGAQITEGSPSLLCMSCHDGKTAINVLHNSSYRDNAPGGDPIIDFNGDNSPFTMDIFDSMAHVNTPNLGAVRDSNGYIVSSSPLNGTDFTDDHPIGFSYTLAAGEKTGKLKPVPDDGIRLFNHRIECSSCHNPHVYYGSGIGMSGDRIDFKVKYGWDVLPAQKERTPFLSVSNKGSQLCLGCHIK